MLRLFAKIAPDPSGGVFLAACILLLVLITLPVMISVLQSYRSMTKLYCEDTIKNG